MIVKPKEHSSKNLGGYLLNNKLFIEPLITRKPISKEKTIIEPINCIYSTVNGLSSTPFKVNTKVLDFILENPREFFNEKRL